MSNSLIATLLVFGALIFVMLSGIPVAFSLLLVGFLGYVVLVGPARAFNLIRFTTTDLEELWLLNAVPLFIFMAYILHLIGVTEDLYQCFYLWLGGVRGGLAMATILVGAFLGAMIGEGASGVVALGIVSLPPMLKRGYDRKMAVGTILAGGGLACIIPPSVLMLIYAEEAIVSFRKLFIAAIVPGLLLTLICICYIGIRCRLDASLGPPIPVENRATIRQKLASLRSLIAPIIIIVTAFILMFIKFFFLSEAAAVGAGGALILALLRRKITWKDFREISYKTLRLSSMIIWIVIGSRVFRALYFLSDANRLLPMVVEELSLSPMGTVLIVNLGLLIMAMFLDAYLILMITLIIAVPLFRTMGVDPVWFGVLFVLNMMIGYLTPPVGEHIFTVRPVVPQEISTADIYRSAVPFVALHVAVMALVMLFPAITSWLPNYMKSTALW